MKNISKAFLYFCFCLFLQLVYVTRLLLCVQVEEGGKAGSLQCPLLAGDEVIIINGVELSGFRQEAVSLVKGSYKTLQLTTRR